MKAPQTTLFLLIFVAPVLSGCVQDPQNPDDEVDDDTHEEIDLVVPSGRWFDLVIPLSPDLRDSDVQFNATWEIHSTKGDGLAKLEYHGFTRDGYMGGPGWWGIFPTTVSGDTVQVGISDVEAAYRVGREQGFDDPVYHLFVSISGDGEATMHLEGRWRDTPLSYSFGNESGWAIQMNEFTAPQEEIPENPGYVTYTLDAEIGERKMAVAFDAALPAGGDALLQPWYERPDGDTQQMRGDFAADFSSDSGKWTFARQTLSEIDEDQFVLWGTLFDPAAPSEADPPSSR